VHEVPCTVAYVRLEVTREALPPRPLKRFTFKDLLESHDRLRESSQNSMVNELKTSHEINGCNETRSKTATRRKIVLQAGATIRGRLSTYVIDSSKS